MVRDVATFAEASTILLHDGDIAVMPELELVEIEAELYTPNQVSALVDVLAAALASLAVGTVQPPSRWSSPEWTVEVVDSDTVLVNGLPHAPEAVNRYLRDLDYATRLITT